MKKVRTFCVKNLEKRKGYTLIEIIICLAIISVVSIISVLFINKNGKNEYNKVINTVTTAADVYYNSNEKLGTKLENNYGYLVLNLDELNNVGIIDKTDIFNRLLDYDDYNNNKELYDKLVIVDEYIAHGEETGGLSIYYPYMQSANKIYVNLKSITIEEHEKKDFKCFWGIDSENVKYLDEDYTLKELKYDCNANLVKDFTDSGGIVELDYSLDNNEEEKVSRSITVNPKYNPYISVRFATTTKKSNKDSELFYINEKVQDITYENTSSNAKIKKAILTVNGNEIKYLGNGNEIKYLENGNDLSELEDGKYIIEYESSLEGIYSPVTKEDSKSISFIVDTKKPEIITDNLNEVSFKDDGSGIAKYIYSDRSLSQDDLNNDSKWETYSSNLTIDASNESRDHYFYVKDKAGNYNSAEIENSKMPHVQVVPKENSISNFYIKINCPSAIDKNNISLRYIYDDYERNIDLSDIDNQTYYEKEINMTELYTSCSYSDSCKRATNASYGNLKMKFVLEIKYDEGKKRTFIINATQNLMIDDSFYISTDYTDFYINDNNDIIYGFTGNAKKYQDVGSYNILLNKNNTKKTLGASYSNMKEGPQFYLVSFDTNKVKFAQCEDWSSGVGKKYKTNYHYKLYEYDISRDTITLNSSVSRLNYSCYGSLAQGTIQRDGTYTILNSDYRSTINSFLGVIYGWDKTNNVVPAIRYSISSEAAFSNKMFEVSIDGKTYLSTIILSVYKDGSKWNRNSYKRVLFYPEVTLNLTTNN